MNRQTARCLSDVQEQHIQKFAYKNLMVETVIVHSNIYTVPKWSCMQVNSSKITIACHKDEEAGRTGINYRWILPLTVRQPSAQRFGNTSQVYIRTCVEEEEEKEKEKQELHFSTLSMCHSAAVHHLYGLHHSALAISLLYSNRWEVTANHDR